MMAISEISPPEPERQPVAVTKPSDPGTLAPDPAQIHWYLIHTKPRQERRALENLERQGYPCYLPIFPVQKIRRAKLTTVEESLFPRYLFIQLSVGPQGMDWGPIRSTMGVSRLVRFGLEAAKVDQNIISFLRARETAFREEPPEHFTPGERLTVIQGPFAGLDAVFQIADGEKRVIVLIEMLARQVKVAVTPGSVRKVAAN
jgi:transcriptional antiterminator RfaH